MILTSESHDARDSPHDAPKGKVTDDQGKAVRVTTLLKGLQPQREVPSKDRERRFAAGNLAGTNPCIFQAMTYKKCSLGAVPNVTGTEKC